METPTPPVQSGWPLFEVFVRGRRGLNHVHVGSLHAADPEMALLAAARVSAVRAARISAAAVRSGRLDSLELERERGRVVWKAELGTRSGVEYEVVVDARSGSILRKQIDD